jgi:hypothetical protein
LWERALKVGVISTGRSLFRLGTEDDAKIRAWYKTVAPMAEEKATLCKPAPDCAAAAGGLVEQLSCGRIGIIAKGMQAEDLAAAIQYFTHDPSLYESCSAGVLRHVREELGFEK